MKRETEMLAKCQIRNPYERRIIEMCFDPASIQKFSPGLKMVYALDDPPLFVKLEEVKHISHRVCR